MATWGQVTAAVPELAEAVLARLTARTHLVLATLRADGAPRVSGTELVVAGGELWLGAMPGARKGADLRRDARFALHGGSDDPPGWTGDGKVAGTAHEVTDDAVRAEVARALPEQPPGPWELWRLALDEIVYTGLGDPPDHLVVWSWHEGRGERRVRRD